MRGQHYTISGAAWLYEMMCTLQYYLADLYRIAAASLSFRVPSAAFLPGWTSFLNPTFPPYLSRLSSMQ